MRYPVLVLTGLVPVLLSACSDSTGPSDKLVRVSVDWPMAREVTFNGAYLESGTLCLSSPCLPEQSVDFDANGRAELEFTKPCSAGSDLGANWLRVIGKYDHATGHCIVDLVFGLGLPPTYLKCTEDVQHFVVERPQDDPQCQPPSE